MKSRYSGSKLILSLLICAPITLFAQSYSPCESLTADKPFLEALELRVKENIDSIRIDQKRLTKQIIEERKEQLLKEIERGSYLDCPALNEYLNQIVSELLSNNSSIRKPVNVLLDRDVSPNAYCTGEGILAINLGLLYHLKNEDQLAFVLAHELSHWHLDHVHKMTETTVQRLSKKELKKDGYLKDLSEGNLDLLKSLVYKSFKYSRNYEAQADSLAIQMILKTKYNPNAAKHALLVIDSLQSPANTTKIDLRGTFDFQQYPFKERWLNELEQGEIYNENAPTFIFNKDSLNSHPVTKDRINEVDRFLRAKLNSNGTEYSDINRSDLDQAIDFESIESALFRKKFPMAIHLWFELENKYGQNEFLKIKKAELLYRLYEARKEHSFGKYVPPVLNNDHWMYPTICFLNNVRMSEYRKMAYYNLKENFQLLNLSEELLYIYWRLINDLKYVEELEFVEKFYQEHYPDGEYLDQIIRTD